MAFVPFFLAWFPGDCYSCLYCSSGITALILGFVLSNYCIGQKSAVTMASDKKVTHIMKPVVTERYVKTSSA